MVQHAAISHAGNQARHKQRMHRVLVDLSNCSLLIPSKMSDRCMAYMDGLMYLQKHQVSSIGSCLDSIRACCHDTPNQPSLL